MAEQTYVGECKYCGTQQTVIAESQAEANDIVMKACDCDGVDIARKKEQLHIICDAIAGELAPDNGFAAVSPEIYPRILEIGDTVVEGRFAAASIKVDGTVISFSRNTKGKVQANRKVVVNKGGAIE